MGSGGGVLLARKKSGMGYKIPQPQLRLVHNLTFEAVPLLSCPSRLI
jgi:hypothetical protein